MVGTILNAAGILIGGFIGLTVARQLSAATQSFLKIAMGALVVFVGLKTAWMGLSGGFLPILKQLLIVIFSMMLGKLIGRLLHLQKLSNRLGQYAKERLAKATPDAPNRLGEGFVTCTLLFCVGPMAILGALQDGLTGNYHTLAIKAVMDGLATLAFAGLFGWGVILSVVPVVAYQGTITLAARLLEPYLRDQALLDSVNATGGLLIFCIALIILELKKIELTDYLPSLAVAPLLTWLWR